MKIIKLSVLNQRQNLCVAGSSQQKKDAPITETMGHGTQEIDTDENKIFILLFVNFDKKLIFKFYFYFYF